MPPTLEPPAKIDFALVAANLAHLMELRLEWPEGADHKNYCHLHDDDERWSITLSVAQRNGKMSAGFNWPKKTADGYTRDHHEAHCSIAISLAKPVAAIAREINTRLVNPCGLLLRKLLESHDSLDRNMAQKRAIMAPLAALFPDGQASAPLDRSVELEFKREKQGITNANVEVDHHCLDWAAEFPVYEPYVKLKLECSPDLAQKIAELIAQQTRPD